MANGEPARPGVGFWLVIAALAIVNTVSILTRPDFDLGDLIVPGVFTAILVGTILAVRVFWPQAFSIPQRNTGLLIGFGIGLISAILLFGASGQLR